MDSLHGAQIRVLMLGWEYPPVISGGLGTACKGLVEGIYATECADITLTLPKYHSQLQALPFPRIVSFSSLSRIGNIYDPIAEDGIYQAVEHYAEELENFSKSQRFDVIHAHDWLTGVAGRKIKLLTGLPLVLHIHSTEIDRGGLGGNVLVRELEKLAMDAADIIVAVSHYTKGLIRRYYDQDERKIRVIHNAMFSETKPIEWTKRGNLITFAGRLTSQKGPEHFVRAAEIALRQDPLLKFVMAGDGDQLASMRRLTQHLKISSSFFFPGFLRSDDLYQLLCRSKLAILPSLSEPFGIVALEAIHAGVPTIISKNYGAGEVLPSLDRVYYWDIRTIADLILRISSDADYAAMQVYSAQSELRQLSWQAAGRQVVDIYSDLMRVR